MAEEMKMSGTNMGWNTVNSVLGVGALGAALGIGIPAVTKAFSRRDEYGRGYGHGCGCGCSENTLVNRFELEQSQRISELESARDTDAKILEVYKAAAASDQRQDEKFAQLTKELTDYVIANNREVDAIKCESKINTQAINDNLRFLDYKIDTNKAELIALIDCKTLPLEKKVGINQICPTPLAACAPVAIQGQIINTDDTATSNTVVGSVKTK